MDEKKEKLNIDEENKKQDLNDPKKNSRKLSMHRKASTSGILKRKNKKSNTIKSREGFVKSSNCIKWDNKAINEQRDYRKNHPMNKEKLKQSKSKFAESIAYNDEDIYMKGLEKVYKLNKNDDVFYKVIMSLNGKLKKMKRINSCFSIGNSQRKYNMSEFYHATEKEKIFDESLGEEQKLTLQNTLFNKLIKDVNDE